MKKKPNSLISNVANLLAEAKTRGLTATKIAEELGVKAYILTNWKTGRSKPSQEQYDKLMNIVMTNAKENVLYSNSNITPIGLLSLNENLACQEDKRLLIINGLFTSLKDTKNKDKVINLAYELWKKESQCAE